MRDSFPFVPEHRLRDPRYRQELLNKVEALISVLEVAHQKVLRNLAAPDSDTERLKRICSNLEGTLEVCRRAKRTLLSAADASLDAAGAASAERALPSPKRIPRKSITPLDPDEMSFREYVEVGSVEEFSRFRDLGPISGTELEDVNLDELCKRLGETEL